MAFAVEEFTLCDGWVQAWTICNEDGSEEPEFFDTVAEAQAALDEFFAEVKEAVKEGNMDSEYDSSSFRIVNIETGEICPQLQ